MDSKRQLILGIVSCALISAVLISLGCDPDIHPICSALVIEIETGHTAWRALAGRSPEILPPENVGMRRQHNEIQMLKLDALMATGIVGCLLLCGCAWSIGDSGHRPGTVIKPPTRGQELIDLKTAKDQGAITEDEYQAQKRKIMER